jgi:hypothetical protein
MLTHQTLSVSRIVCLAFFALVSNATYSQCDSRLLDDSSFCHMWKKDSVGLMGFRSTNYLKLANCYLATDTPVDGFSKLYRAKLLTALGQPNEIKSIRNNRKYCTDWWQEYIYYVDTNSEFKYDIEGKSTGTYISFVFDQCEKYLIRISYGYYLQKKNYR